ncbi:MAG: alpha/beta fold hydrolase [Myxococcota bacterium]
MAFEDPPALPDFIGRMFPQARRAYRLQRGADAGRRIHLVDDGPADGTAVVMVHGNPTWSFLWRKVIAALPEGRYRCIAPDLLGLGMSDRLPELTDHTLERHADAVAEVVEACDVDRIIVVGQDWGGPIAASVGARMADRVAGIVFGNTSVIAPTRPRGTAFHRFAQLPILSDLAFRGLSLPVRVMSRVQGDRKSISGDVAKAYRFPMRTSADRTAPLALARMVPNAVSHPSMPELARGQAFVEAFAGPAALVWGTRDPILGRALRRHERLLPDAPVTVTSAGHFLQEEVPDALAAAIDDVAGRAASA